MTSSIAAMAFIEGVSYAGTLSAVNAWFQQDLLPWDGLSWRVLREPGHRPVELDDADPEPLRALLADARDRVVDSLRGLISKPPDDAFLGELVGRGFVKRRVEPTGVRWVASVTSDRYLSELVLALLAADILARRAVYDERLCVCEQCGRVSFEPSQSPRDGCPSHKSPRRDFRRVVRRAALRG